MELPTSGVAVMCVQNEQWGTEHNTLGGLCVENSSQVGLIPNQSCQGSVCEKVQYLAAECGTQSAKLQ